MKSLFSLVLVLVGGFVLASEDAKKDDPADDIKKFDGTWIIKSYEIEGKDIEGIGDKEIRITFKDGKFTQEIADGGKNDGSVKLDPSQKTKTIDLVYTEGPHKGETHKGIYVLDGDTLKVCKAGADKDRPTEFATKEDSGHTMYVLKREKK